MTVRILVADDSITIQKIVAMAFENEDAKVEGIGDGQEAFDKIPDFKPDIVLADVEMPGLDGFELCQKIKETPELASIKVLLLASDFEDFDEGRFKECQAENHISKPFKSDDIVQMVIQVMEGTVVAETVAAEPSASVEEPEKDDEPSLEELLESVEKLSTDSMGMMEDNPLPVELVEPADEDEVPSFDEEIADDDILGQMIQEVESEISPDPAPVDTSDNDVLSQMMQDVEKEIGSDPAPVDTSDDDVLSQMMQDVEKEIGSDPVPADTSDDDVLSQMMQDVKETQQVSEPAIEEPVLEEQGSFAEDFEVYAEVRSRKMESFDDLDSAFKEIVSGDAKQSASSEMKESEISVLGGIVPEPEDLLERMAPGAFSGAERQVYSSEELSPAIESPRYQDSPNDENSDDRFIQVTGEQVRQVLERSLSSSLQKEMSGLSGIILKTIREVVREITPEIARSIIREEIEKIKSPLQGRKY